MFTVRLYFVKNNKLQFYFPEDENSTCQSGWVIYYFHSPEGLDTRISEWASTNFKPCLEAYSSVLSFKSLFKTILTGFSQASCDKHFH